MQAEKPKVSMKPATISYQQREIDIPFSPYDSWDHWRGRVAAVKDLLYRGFTVDKISIDPNIKLSGRMLKPDVLARSSDKEVWVEVFAVTSAKGYKLQYITEHFKGRFIRVVDVDFIRRIWFSREIFDEDIFPIGSSIFAIYRLNDMVISDEKAFAYAYGIRREAKDEWNFVRALSDPMWGIASIQPTQFSIQYTENGLRKFKDIYLGDLRKELLPPPIWIGDDVIERTKGWSYNQFTNRAKCYNACYELECELAMMPESPKESWLVELDTGMQEYRQALAVARDNSDNQLEQCITFLDNALTQSTDLKEPHWQSARETLTNLVARLKKIMKFSATYVPDELLDMDERVSRYRSLISRSASIPFGLSRTPKIEKLADRKYEVESFTADATYVVDLANRTCTCPSHQREGRVCKHIAYLTMIIEKKGEDRDAH